MKNMLSILDSRTTLNTFKIWITFKISSESYSSKMFYSLIDSNLKILFNSCFRVFINSPKSV